MTTLRRRIIDDMTVRNLSLATQQSYVYAVAKFSRFFECSPDRLGIEEVRAYQLHLAGLGWSWSHIKPGQRHNSYHRELSYLATMQDSPSVLYGKGVISLTSPGCDRAARAERKSRDQSCLTSYDNQGFP
jgi:hypothetical protein